MNFDQLIAKLRDSGVTTSPSTIRRWAQASLITAPERRHRQKGEGRGKKSDWPDQTLYQIAGRWAVRHYGSQKFGFSKQTYEEAVRAAQKLANYFYADPICWQLNEKQALHDKLYVGDKPDEVDRLIGEQFWEADLSNFAEWVAAGEKIRRGLQISERLSCNFVFERDSTINGRILQYHLFGVFLWKIGEASKSEILVTIIDQGEGTKLVKKIQRRKKSDAEPAIALKDVKSRKEI